MEDRVRAGATLGDAMDKMSWAATRSAGAPAADSAVSVARRNDEALRRLTGMLGG